MILVNAQSEAEKTKLEGNAEAGIVFTKGESEAKALALRAEAYRQFNDAAIIQTVLSMLPEIVRAAAEPMAAIDSLTVLSTDGASDVVKNATRTVTEAGAVVKGLTGIDVPSLISGAIQGGSGSGRGRSGGGGGTGGGEGGTGARRSSRPSGPSPAPAPAGAAGASASPGAEAVSTAERDVGTAAGAVSGAARATTAASRDVGAVAGRAGTDAEAAVAAGEAASREAAARVEASLEGARQRLDTAARAAPAAAGLTRDTTVNVAAQRLARDLAAIPGIERFGALRLGDLDRAGPRPLRMMWRLARHELADRYGQMTIGEIVDRFGGRGGGAAPTA